MLQSRLLTEAADSILLANAQSEIPIPAPKGDGWLGADQDIGETRRWNEAQRLPRSHVPVLDLVHQ